MRIPIAAGILLLVSVIAVLWRTASSPKPPREERAVLPQPVSSPVPQTPPLTPTEPPVDRDQVVARAVRMARGRQTLVPGWAAPTLSAATHRPD